MGPVPGADVVGRVGVESARRREHAIRGPGSDSIRRPAQDERLKIEIREASAGTQLPCRIRGERVVRHEQRRGGREPRAAQQCASIDPYERIQVDHHGVCSRRHHLTVRSLRLVASVEDEQVRVREPRIRHDAGVGRAHAGRIHASGLCFCEMRHRQSSDGRQHRSPEVTRTAAPHPVRAHRPVAVAPTWMAAGWRRLASTRASGISMANETIMTTVIITTTLGSPKFCPATTSAAAVLRWAVPRASTPRVSAPGPPSTEPMPKQTATKITAATMPNEPRMLTMLPRCPAVVRTTTKIMLMLEMGATNALTRPAAGGY